MVETKTEDINEARAKEFLSCLGHGKSIYQLEQEEDLEHQNET